tara:strand:+ start:1107 stop:2531 length:1425 start_codon:yes stop_codon:yes gene_type:complete
MDEKIDDYDVLDVLGVTGLNRQGGLVNEEWLRQLEGTKGVKVYTEMKDNDPIIGAILYAIKTLVRQTKATVQPSGTSEKHHYYAKFVNECLSDMSVSWPDFLSEALSMLPFGWAYFETLYKIRSGHTDDPKTNSIYRDGRLGWRKFGIRAQDTLYRWEFSDEGETLGMWQMAPPNYELTFLPIEKCVHFRTESHKNNPEGRSILRNAYRSWFFCKRIQEIESIGIERDLAGLPVMQVPLELLSSNATAAQKAVVDDFRDMIQKIRRDEYEGVVIPSETDIDGNPSGFKLSLLSSGGRRPIDVNEIVKRYESRTALSVLGEFVLLGMDSHGSFALASSKTTLFAQALGTYLQTISTTFNEQAIAPLMRLNGWPEAEYYPKLVFSDIETPDVRELGAALTGLAGAGLITPDDTLEKWIREFANLPPVDLGSERPAEEEAHEDELYNEDGSQVTPGRLDEEVIDEKPTVEGEEVEDA